jgi:hypothetical protein
MEVLFAFLSWAASFSHVDEESGSKMDIHNLATVMTPNILYPNTKTASMDESFLAIEAVASLIAYNDVMCEVRIRHHLFAGKTDINRFPRIFNRFSMILASSKTVPTSQPRKFSNDMVTLARVL